MSYFNQAQWERLSRVARAKREAQFNPTPDQQIDRAQFQDWQVEETSTMGMCESCLEDAPVSDVEGRSLCKRCKVEQSMGSQFEPAMEQAMGQNMGRMGQFFDRQPFAPPKGVDPGFESVADEAQRIFRNQMDGNLSGAETRVLLTNLAESVGFTYEQIADWMFSEKNAHRHQAVDLPEMFPEPPDMPVEKEFDPLAAQPRGTLPRPDRYGEESWADRSTYGQLDLMTYDHDWQDVCDAADEVYSHPDFPENHDKYPPMPEDLQPTNGVDMWSFSNDTNDYPAYECVYHGSPEDVAARLNAIRSVEEASKAYGYAAQGPFDDTAPPDVEGPPDVEKQGQLGFDPDSTYNSGWEEEVNEAEFPGGIEQQERLEPGMRVEEGPLPNQPRVVKVTKKYEGGDVVQGDIITIPTVFEVQFGQPEYGGYGTYEATKTDLYQIEQLENGAISWNEGESLQTIYTIDRFLGSDAKRGWDMWLDKHKGSNNRRPYDQEIYNELAEIWESYMVANEGDEAKNYESRSMNLNDPEE